MRDTQNQVAQLLSWRTVTWIHNIPVVILLNGSPMRKSHNGQRWMILVMRESRRRSTITSLRRREHQQTMQVLAPLQMTQNKVEQDVLNFEIGHQRLAHCSERKMKPTQQHVDGIPTFQKHALPLCAVVHVMCNAEEGSTWSDSGDGLTHTATGANLPYYGYRILSRSG